MRVMQAAYHDDKLPATFISETPSSKIENKPISPTMSHPAASIKSIFSGKINLTDTEHDDCSTARDSISTESQQGMTTASDYPGRIIVDVDTYDQPSLSDPGYDYRKSGRDTDNFSVSSKNLRIMALQKGTDDNFEARTTSTNISLASSDSDYQQAFTTDADAYFSDSSQPELDPPDSISRPISRNSTTSCLLTTATKDGVEGKKLHRHGPTPYFSNVIANMIHHQHQNPAVPQRISPEIAILQNQKAGFDSDLHSEGLRERGLASSGASADS